MSAHGPPPDPSRRQFLATTLGGLLSASGIGCGLLGSRPGPPSSVPPGASNFPIVPVRPEEPLRAFTGDAFERPHAALWQKEAFLRERGGRLPEPQERVPVAIVGGGMAGLTAAYLLRDLHPLLLEQDPRLGGNAKGERWGDLAYSIGAAYVARPEEGEPTHALLSELNLLPASREEGMASEATVLKDGTLWNGFWDGVTDPPRADSFRRVAKELARIGDDEFPDIPRTDESALSAEEMDALDRTPFRDWLRTKFGDLHPHLREFLRAYCWSSFGGDDTEISAAQALNFLTADLGGILAYPGGNAAIAQALAERLDRLRTGVVVFDIERDDAGVRISYADASGALHAVRARTCIVACPKFVARRLLRDPGRSAAMGQLEYRAYLVANVLLRQPLRSPCYELFRLTGRLHPEARPREAFRDLAFTDLVFGAWAAHDRPDRSALTLYAALPFKEGRNELILPEAYEQARAGFEREMPDLLGALGVHPDRVESLRIARWGHALPLASVGLLAEGIPQRAAAPIDDAIFFAQQDNWANPCVESAIGTAMTAAGGVRKALKNS
ncbi:MAG: FAD-dependent oxidoreductase [Planctomycetes bacterium]|nr:FAD-dependent oxidoreductase [Planctomycetota bacterium]